MTIFPKMGIPFLRRGGSVATLVLFSVTLMGLGVSIAGLGALALNRPAAVPVAAPATTPVPEAMTPDRALLSSEVVIQDPAVGVIWTMQVLPEDQEGREFTIQGTMEAPAGVQPGQEINMRLFYTETLSQDVLETAPGGLDLERSGIDAPMVVASRVEYMVTGAGGSEWGYQVDLVPARLSSGSVVPAGMVSGSGIGDLPLAGHAGGMLPMVGSGASPCDKRVQL